MGDRVRKINCPTAPTAPFLSFAPVVDLFFNSSREIIFSLVREKNRGSWGDAFHGRIVNVLLIDVISFLANTWWLANCKMVKRNLWQMFAK